VLCLGMSECPSFLFDLFSEMIADPTTAIKSLLFLSDDPLSQDQTIQKLLSGRTKRLFQKPTRRLAVGLCDIEIPVGCLKAPSV
jgi:hypothetical protein